MAEITRARMPNDRWEIFVEGKVEAVLLNKISRKSMETREYMRLLRGWLDRYMSGFEQMGPPVDIGGLIAHSGALAAVHRDLLQVEDIGRAAELDPELVEEARAGGNPVFHWGVRE